MPTGLMITLNARLRPLDRGERYEDPLQEVLDVLAPGSVITGGGTLLGADREPTVCDIDIDLEGDPDRGLRAVIEALQSLGAPKGSTARLGEREPVRFGATEGLGVYLNGTDLPADVYETNDANDLIQQLLTALGDAGDMQSYWEGARETALYFYGPSAAGMRVLLDDVLNNHPLAQRCRVTALE